MENRLASPHTWLRLALWAVVCWVVIFWKLGDPSLIDPDEPHYAQLTREMWHAGSWMIPLLDGAPYIDKPVLFHWLQGAAIALVGETELAMRLPSALAALALLWLTSWTGTQLFDGRIGTRAWLMLATIPLTFMLASIGLFDMVFTAFLFGAVALALVAALRQRPHLQWMSYVLLSLAVMIKGPVALVLAGLFFVAALACDRDARNALLSLHWVTGAVLSVALSLPWFIGMYYALGWPFVHQYVLAGNLYYVTQPQSFSNRAFNHTLYVSTFFAGFFPWSLLTVGAAVDAVRRWRAGVRMTPAEKLLWVWIGVIFIFFSLARFKVDRYVYPAAPACCLLAARAWMSVSSARHDVAAATDNAGARWSLAILGIILVIAGVAAGFSVFDLGLELPRAAVLVPIGLGAAGIALAATIFKRRVVSPVLLGVVVAMFLLIYATVIAVGLPVLERTRPTAEVAASIRPQLGPQDRVGLYRLEKWRFSLRYYLERPVERLEHPEDVQAFFNHAPGGYVLMLDEDLKRLRDAGMDLRVITGRPAVTGTTGRGLRKQKWGALVVTKLAPSSIAHRR